MKLIEAQAMTKTRIYISFTFIVPLIIYILWPLSSSRWDIHFNEADTRQKEEFLADPPSPNSAPSFPNILFIVVDDLGMTDLTLYGNGYPATPHINKLGDEGVVFTNAYVTSPVCSPSRAAMLTGRYPQRFGFQFQMHDRYLKNRLEYLGFKYAMDSYPWLPKWMDDVPNKKAMSKQGIPPSEILLPELLQTKGYHTAMIGKWHLGSDEMQIPCNLGFDYQYGFYASHSLYAYENTDGIHDQKIKGDFTDQYIWKGQRNGPHAIFRNCEEIEVHEYLTDRFADEAVDYIVSQETHPFFLYLSFNAPHTPLQAPSDYMEKFAHIHDPVKRTYYAMIDNLDDNIGKVLSALERLGIRENTVIFFISDNGGAEYTFTTENGNYKGGKITDFEGGIKVPFIINWEGKLTPSVYEPVVSSMDIFQSIVELLDIKLPTERTYDGVNLFPFIQGEKKSLPHSYLFWQRGFSKAVRGNEWKVLLNEEAEDTLLFHISGDPFETENQSDQHPEMVKELITALNIWSSQLPAPQWPSMVYYVYDDGSKIHYFDQ